MVLNIYLDLQGHITINNILNNWKNINCASKNKAILDLIINMTGFAYEMTIGEVGTAENPANYQEIVRKVVESDFDHKKRIIDHPNKKNIVKRFDSFAELLVKTFDNNTGRDWMNSLIKFTDELIKNKCKMSDLVMIAAFIRVIFLKHLMALRARCEREQEFLSNHTSTMASLTNFCKTLFGSFTIGLSFKDFHEIYVNVGLSLFRMYPDFLILDWNQLEVFEELLTTGNKNTITQSYETLCALMEGHEIEDNETKEDIRMEISDFFENYLDTLFIDMVLHEKIYVSKEAFQLLILVQKFRGSTSIIKDKESLESINNSFMRDSKVIRTLAMNFMRLIMKPEAILPFILECLEKYDVSVAEIMNSIFDREIFSQWDLYGAFLDGARNKKRSVNVVTQIMKHSLDLLTTEYQEYELNHPSEASEGILHDAKIDILEFLRVFPKFLYVYRVTAPNPESYTKMLKMINGVKFEDLSSYVTENCLENVKKELFAGLESFDMFPVIDAVTTTLLKLRDHFEEELNEEILNHLMYCSGIFVAKITEIETPEDEKLYKRATYFVYSCLATKPTLLEDKTYEDFFTDSFETMTDDNLLEKVSVRCVVLAILAQILVKYFKILVNKRENLDTVEAAMKVILQKMRSQMIKATESRIIVVTDMKLILINAANLMNYLSFRQNEAENFTLTFSCLVKLTEMILTSLDIPQFFGVFKDFYELHYQIIPNHEEIVYILRHYGQPTLQKHFPTFIKLLMIPHSHDLTTDKKNFRTLIATTIISIENEDNISLFWAAFRKFLTDTLKLKTKDFLTFIANMTFEILQQQLALPQVPEVANRFQILGMITEILEDMRKSPAVMTSVLECFSQIQQKHQNDFTEDENHEIKKFMKELSNERRRRGTRSLQDES